MSVGAHSATGWEALSSGMFSEAHESFAAELETQPADRDARLGAAVSLLLLQPRTETRLIAAIERLETLLAENEVDEVGLNARYFRARIEHVHRLPAAPLTAIGHYEKLIAIRPDHPVAEQALVKLAILRIYGASDAADRRARFAYFDSRVGIVRDIGARRDLHLALGEAALRFHLGDEPALEHFVAALEAGIRLRPLRADTLVRVGELAGALGRPELARAHYRTFLDEFPRDPRQLAVRQRFEALASSPSTLAAVDRLP